jgi:hypothetical protein
LCPLLVSDLRKNSLEVLNAKALGVCSDVRLQLVLEVGEEHQIVIELDLECLIVVGDPLSMDLFLIAIHCIGVWAELGPDTEVRLDLNLPNVFIRERERMTRLKDLETVRQLVCAKFLNLK